MPTTSNDAAPVQADAPVQAGVNVPETTVDQIRSAEEQRDFAARVRAAAPGRRTPGPKVPPGAGPAGEFSRAVRDDAPGRREVR